MFFIVICLIIVVILLYKEKDFIREHLLIKEWVEEYRMPLLVIGVTIALVLFVILVIVLAPGTESGQWYNGGVNSVV